MSDSLQELSALIVETIREPLLILDADLHIIAANQPFYETFRVSAHKIEHRLIYDLWNGGWNIPQFRQWLDNIFRASANVENFEVEHEFPVIGHRTLLVSARRLKPQENRAPLILLTFEDMTAILREKD